MANSVIPALSVPYGRTSYWDELKQKKAQGYTVSDKQALATAYGERYGELANEMNRQKINRDLSLQEYKATNDVAYQNKMLDLNRDTADKTWYGQLAGLGISALLNSDKLIKGGTNLWNLGEKGYDTVKDWMNGGTPALSGDYYDPTDFGMNIDQYMDFADLGYDPAAIDAYFGANELATWGADASSYSVPWYSMTKYGTQALNSFADANNIQQISNFTEPMTGVFEGISRGISEMVAPVWDFLGL